MPRTIIDIPAAQMRDLDSRCRALGISRAEGVRRAVHAFVNVKHGLDQAGFGLWAQSAADNTDGRGRQRAAQGKTS
jgi:hypothetical protein